MRASYFTRDVSQRRTTVDVAIIGNLTIDVIMRGIEQMPPWGHEVLSHTRTEATAGQAGAMAFACVALGARTEILADVGEDDTGERIRRELQSAGVGTEALGVVPGGVTPLTIAVVRGDGERAFISDLGRLRPLDVGALARRFPHVVDAAVLALVGTSNLADVDLRGAAAALGIARRSGSLSVFDSGWDPDEWSAKSVEGIKAVLAETDLYLPNLDEARALTGRTAVGEVLRQLAAWCAGVVIVKGGAVGSYTLIDGDVVLVEAVPTEVDNAVGAGDVFNAGTIAGYLRGRDVIASVSLGTAAASMYVSRRQNRFPTFSDVEALAHRVVVSEIDVHS